MATLKPKDLRELPDSELQEKLNGLLEQLINLRGEAAMGGAPMSPGKIRAVRTDIARLKTIQREREVSRT